MPINDFTTGVQLGPESAPGSATCKELLKQQLVNKDEEMISKSLKQVKVCEQLTQFEESVETNDNCFV